MSEKKLFEVDEAQSTAAPAVQNNCNPKEKTSRADNTTATENRQMGFCNAFEDEQDAAEATSFLQKYFAGVNPNEACKILINEKSGQQWQFGCPVSYFGEPAFIASVDSWTKEMEIASVDSWTKEMEIASVAVSVDTFDLQSEQEENSTKERAISHCGILCDIVIGDNGFPDVETALSKMPIKPTYAIEVCETRCQFLWKFREPIHFDEGDMQARELAAQRIEEWAQFIRQGAGNYAGAISPAGLGVAYFFVPFTKTVDLRRKGSAIPQSEIDELILAGKLADVAEEVRAVAGELQEAQKLEIAYPIKFTDKFEDSGKVDTALGFLRRWFSEASGNSHLYYYGQLAHGKWEFPVFNPYALQEELEGLLAEPSRQADVRTYSVKLDTDEVQVGLMVELFFVDYEQEGKKRLYVNPEAKQCRSLEAAREAVERFANTYNLVPEFMVDVVEGVQIYWKFHFPCHECKGWLDRLTKFRKFFGEKTGYRVTAQSWSEYENAGILPGTYAPNQGGRVKDMKTSRLIYLCDIDSQIYAEEVDALLDEGIIPPPPEQDEFLEMPAQEGSTSQAEAGDAAPVEVDDPAQIDELKNALDETLKEFVASDGDKDSGSRRKMALLTSMRSSLNDSHTLLVTIDSGYMERDLECADALKKIISNANETGLTISGDVETVEDEFGGMSYRWRPRSFEEALAFVQYVQQETKQRAEFLAQSAEWEAEENPPLVHDAATTMFEKFVVDECEKNQIAYISKDKVKTINVQIKKSKDDAWATVEEALKDEGLRIASFDAEGATLMPAAAICMATATEHEAAELRTKLSTRLVLNDETKTATADLFKRIELLAKVIQDSVQRFENWQEQVKAATRNADFFYKGGTEIPVGYNVSEGFDMLKGTNEKGKDIIIAYCVPVISEVYGRAQSKTFCADIKIFRGSKMTTIPQVDYKTLLDTKEVMKLADYGLLFNSSRAKQLVQYFAASLNQKTWKRAEATLHEKVGWNVDSKGQDVFVTPADSRHSIDARAGHFIMSTVKKKGAMQGWCALAQEVEKFTIPRFVLAASLATPLLKILNVRTFSIYIFAGSRAGKSAACRFAASAWGSPDFVRNLDTTLNGLEVELAENNDFPFFSDEKQLSKVEMPQMIYKLAQCQQRGRATAAVQVRDRKTWRTIGIFSGEESVLDEVTTQGAVTRCLQIAVKDDSILPADLAKRIYTEIHENYGWAGSAFVEELLKENWDKVRALFENFVEHAQESTPKELIEDYYKYMALCGVAYMLYRQNVMQDSEATAMAQAMNLIKGISAQIETKQVLSDSQRQLELVAGWITENTFAIEGHPNLPKVMMKDGGAGTVESDVIDERALAKKLIGFYDGQDKAGNEGGFLYINETPLRTMLKQHGYNFSAVCSNLAKENYFMLDKSGRGFCKTHNGARARFIKIPFVKDVDEFE